MGPRLADRLVTQLYSVGNPLLDYDETLFFKLPEANRKRVIAHYHHYLTIPDVALGYRFDIVLRGSEGLPSMPNTHMLTVKEAEPYGRK